MSEASKSAVAVAGNPESTASCWSCGDMRAAHFCRACGKVQPPAPADYFTFFGLPRLLNLDTARLEKEFYEFSRRLHPDLAAHGNPEEQRWSLEQSSLLNDAYRTLKDPLRRTEYLLQLEGVELEEQSKSATEQARASGQIKKQVVPPDLLEEVFELNIQLEELRMQKKIGEDDPALLREIGEQRLQFEEKRAVLLDELKALWNRWDKAVGDGDEKERRVVRDKMVDLLNRHSYIRNLVRDVNETLEIL